MAVTGHFKLLNNGVPVFSATEVPALVKKLAITDILFGNRCCG
jgi:hypothetical protein